MTSFYSQEDLQVLGFKSIGSNIFISRKASFYGISDISIGNYVRIDDFCVLSAGSKGIEIGDHVHIAVFSSLIGEGKITLEDFVNISSRVSIYSNNDDYSGNFMTGPMVPAAYTNVDHADVILCKHVIIGSGSVVLPGVTLKEGAAVGALSMVNRDCEEFCIYKGNPAKIIAKRSRRLLELEAEFRRGPISSK